MFPGDGVTCVHFVEEVLLNSKERAQTAHWNLP